MKVSFSKPSTTPAVPATVAETPAAAAPAATAPAAPAATAPAAPAATAPAAPAAAVVTSNTPDTAGTPAAAAPVTPTTAHTVTDNDGQAVAVRSKTSTAVEVSKPAVFFDDETMDIGDLVLPRLSVVQKVGELSTVFPPGSIVLNGQLVLAPAGKAMEVSPAIGLLVIGFQPTVFVEKVEGGGRGDIFHSEVEVVEAGGTLDWNVAQATKKILFQRMTTAMVLIEQPEGLDAASFPQSFGGKNYALALYTMKGTAYTNAARAFKSAKKVGHLVEGYRTGWWTFQSQLKKFGENYAYIPVVKARGASTPELRAELLNLLGF